MQERGQVDERLILTSGPVHVGVNPEGYEATAFWARPTGAMCCVNREDRRQNWLAFPHELEPTNEYTIRRIRRGRRR